MRLIKIKNTNKDPQVENNWSRASSTSNEVSIFNAKKDETQPRSMKENIYVTPNQIDAEIEKIKIDYNKIKFVRDNYKNIKKLGDGAFGIVYLGNYNNEQVAIKELKPERLSEAAIAEFKKEAMIMCNLKHPNIVRSYGICTERESIENPPAVEKYICIVMEYATNGSLGNIIDNHAYKFSITEIIKILKQLASALKFLHEPPISIIHRDLKPTNILFDNEKNVKLVDFGLAKVKKDSSTNQKSDPGKGTPRWMAPELLTEQPTVKSDIYAFGVILWQLFTRQLPYTTAAQTLQVYYQIDKKVWNFNFPSHIPPELKELALQCLKENKAYRPTAAKILTRLEQIELQISKYQNASENIY